METKIFDINIEDIDKNKIDMAANILRSGGTVAFPTETVYGLGANALDEKAVKKIFEAKGRPSDNPLIVHVSNKEALKDLVKDIPKKAEILIEEFWPGPLTLIFRKSDIVPDIISAGLPTVAIRMPSHPIALELIRKSGVPIAAPSANISGKPSPTKGEHVVNDLDGKVDAIIIGGSSSVGVESTVLDVTKDIPVILRPGGVTKEDIREIIGKVEIDKSIDLGMSDDIIPMSPGMKYKHYAPKASVIVVEGDLEKVISKINKLKNEKTMLGYKIGILATEETKKHYENSVIMSIGSRKNIDTIARGLFDTLRKFDKEDVDIILAEGIERKGLGYAVMNRMLKSAGYNVIKAGD